MIFDNHTYKKLGLTPQNTKVAFQGSPGSFSDIAMREFFGTDTKQIPSEDFTTAYKGVLSGKAHFGILPIENTLIGTIYPSLDDLVAFENLTVIADKFIKIEHSLIGLPQAHIKNVKAVYSQWPAIDQCKEFLDLYPHWERKAFHDTAAAVKYIAEKNNPEFAAVASVRAAEIYGLKILKKNIETNSRNYTRFVVVMNKKKSLYKKYQAYIDTLNLSDNIALLVFTTADKPGALLQCLSVLSLYQINMHKIESRPIVGKPWEYQFSVELNFQDADIDLALLTLKHVAKEVHIVGIYKK